MKKTAVEHVTDCLFYGAFIGLLAAALIYLPGCSRQAPEMEPCYGPGASACETRNLRRSMEYQEQLNRDHAIVHGNRGTKRPLPGNRRTWTQ